MTSSRETLDEQQKGKVDQLESNASLGMPAVNLCPSSSSSLVKNLNACLSRCCFISFLTLIIISQFFVKVVSHRNIIVTASSRITQSVSHI